MPSTVIRRFVYDEMTSDLWIEFTTGRRYVYSGVPQEVADAFSLTTAGGEAAAFRAAFARGVYFNTRIRDQFPYREIVHADEETQS